MNIVIIMDVVTHIYIINLHEAKVQAYYLQ